MLSSCTNAVQYSAVSNCETMLNRRASLNLGSMCRSPKKKSGPSSSLILAMYLSQSSNSFEGGGSHTLPVPLLSLSSYHET